MIRERKIIYTLLYTLVLLIVSCSQTEGTEEDCINISYDNAKIEELFLSEYYKDFEIISLTLPKDKQIADIDDIVFSNSRIFVLDRTSTKSISIFSNSGEFISRIRNLGRGPGEYTNVPDFDVDQINKEIILLDWGGAKLCIFNLNGDHLRDIKLNNSYSDVTSLNSSLYLINTISDKAPPVTKFSYTGEQEDILLGNNDIYRSSVLFLRRNGSTFKIGNKIIVTFPHSPIIYKVSDDGVNPYIKIKSDEFNSFFQNINDEGSLSMERQVALPIISNYSENSEFATFELSMNKKLFYNYYSFSSNTFTVYEKINDDILNLKPVILKLEKNSLLAYLDPYQVFKLKEKLINDEISMPDELANEIKKQSYDYNCPILIRYYAK